MKELLGDLARSLVSRPEEVKVTESVEADGSLVLELAVADSDYGTVIGRGGRTAAALRTVVKAAGAASGQRVFVDIID